MVAPMLMILRSIPPSVSLGSLDFPYVFSVREVITWLNSRGRKWKHGSVILAYLKQIGILQEFYFSGSDSY